MLKAIAIDDEPFALEVIDRYASGVPYIQMVASFTNAFEAIAYLRIHTVDVLFLDIKMPDISGIDLLKGIPNAPIVIFTTAYSEYAVQSFELDATDYLLKPFSMKRFLKACEKAKEQYEYRKSNTAETLKQQAIFIKSGYEKFQVEPNDILFVESVSNYVRFVLVDKTIVARLTMNQVALLLPADDFIRIHRCHIISKKFITKADKKSIWIKDREFPVGIAYQNATASLFN